MRTLICLIVLFFGYYMVAEAQNEYPVIDEYITNYQFDKALKAIDNEEPTKELLQMKAVCYKGLDNYSKAVEVLHSLSEEYPDDLKIKSEMALCYQALSNWSAGLNCYDHLIELDSLNVYYKIKRAEMLFRLDNYKDALADYILLTDEYSLNNMIKRSAQCFENMNLPDSAMTYYRKAIEVDSMDVFSMASLININIKESNFGAAMKLSDSFIKRDSTNKQINLLNSLSYYGADFYEEAVPRFERCYLNGDSSLVVNRSLGISYYSLGENEKALPYLIKAHAQDSTNLRVLYCLAVMSNELKDYTNAVNYFGTLLDRTIPPDGYLYLYYRGLAKAHEGLEESKEAVENYMIATKYATKIQNMYLYYSIGTIYDYDLRQADKALEYYLKYKKSLKDYLGELQKKENQEENDQIEIKQVESSIGSLNWRTERLEKELATSANTPKQENDSIL